ncbi:glycosyltransferase family 39 protein, partial [Acidisphaera rubrifaciens]|uniref:glycosyltransferase family 39 protein n=1 Tax=Acidisphaera rubrifaciens TaxID=50715 RepID=UPI000A8ADFBA
MELRRLRHSGLAGPLSTTRAVAALAVLTVLRLVVAGMAPLSPDEAYYWVWSHALSAGFPDHPPMVALWIRAGTALAGQGALGVRLLGPLSAAIGSVLLADAAPRLLPDLRSGAGIGAAVALNATLMFAAGAVIMTPDTPLLFFWTAAIWALTRFAAPGASDRARILWLLGAGLAVGLAACSKYTAAFLGLGAGAWFLLVPSLRPWLRRPWPWLAGLLSVAVFSPVLWWNAAHGWASLLRQGGRVGEFAPARAAQFLGELIAGQLGLATPLLAVLFAAGLVVALRRAWGERAPGWTLLALLSWPPLAVFVEHT